MANRTFVRSQRMAKHWHFIPSLEFALTAAGTNVGGNLQLDGPFTVLRMLGSFLCTNSGTVVAGDAVNITIGIGVVSADAIAGGATTLPDPNGEPDYPWLYWEDVALFFRASGSPGLEEGPGANVLTKFDIKSMRKIKPREGLVVVLSYTDNAGTPPIQVQFNRTRVLVAT